MSFSTHRRDALDSELPLRNRMSHARSLAMLMGHKYRVHRDVIIAHVMWECGVDLNVLGTAAEVEQAVRVLDTVKVVGLGRTANTVNAELGDTADGVT